MLGPHLSDIMQDPMWPWPQIPPAIDAAEQRRRERFELVKAAFTGFLSRDESCTYENKDLARWCVDRADAVLAELAKERAGGGA